MSARPKKPVQLQLDLRVPLTCNACGEKGHTALDCKTHCSHCHQRTNPKAHWTDDTVCRCSRVIQ